MRRIKNVVRIGICFVILTGSSVLFVDELQFPTKPIIVAVPGTLGGRSDVQARLCQAAIEPVVSFCRIKENLNVFLSFLWVRCIVRVNEVARKGVEHDDAEGIVITATLGPSFSQRRTVAHLQTWECLSLMPCR